MTVRIIKFDPIIVMVDDVVVPTEKAVYTDKNGISNEILYVMAGGEKFPIQHRVELMEDLKIMKVDEVLAKIESDKNEVKP